MLSHPEVACRPEGRPSIFLLPGSGAAVILRIARHGPSHKAGAMPPKKNPLNLNALQLKTLTLAQALARLPNVASPDEQEAGAIRIEHFPHPHGNHFHLGSAVVATKDASGLFVAGVWAALERKGLTRGDGIGGVVIRPAGLAYDTGLAGEILHGSDH